MKQYFINKNKIYVNFITSHLLKKCFCRTLSPIAKKKKDDSNNTGTNFLKLPTFSDDFMGRGVNEFA